MRMSNKSRNVPRTQMTVGERLVLIEDQLDNIDKWMSGINDKLDNKYAEKDDIKIFDDRLRRMEKSYYTISIISIGVVFGILLTIAIGQDPNIFKMLF